MVHRVNGDVDLGNDVYKVTQETILLKNQKCVITVQEGTLAALLYLRNEPVGYVFHGLGRFNLDTIIETNQGALGKSTVKGLSIPFMMFAGKDFQKELSSSMVPATSEAFFNMGYKNAEGLIAKALDVCKGFLNYSRHANFGSWSEDKKMFVFPQDSIFEILLSSSDNTTYVAKDKVYIFGKDKQMFTGPGEVVVAKQGKLVTIKNGCVFVKK